MSRSRFSLCIIAILLILFSACTHTKKLTDSTPGEFYETINEKGKGKKGIITRISGEWFYAKEINVTKDSTTWVEPADGIRKIMPTDSVANIKYRYHGRGAGEGLGVGFLIFGGLGALLGVANGPIEEYGYSRGDLGFAVGAVFGTVGGVVLGLPIGAAAGSQDKYELRKQ